MKKLFKNSKLLLILSTCMSILAVFVCSVATLTWFQINSQSPQTSLVSGSADVNIDKVTGYKIEQKYNANGQINYSNNTVVSKDAVSDETSASTNYDKEDADTNFDVPNKGIGYYLVKPDSEGSYKFSNSPEYLRFEEFTAGSLAHVDSVYFSASTLSFRIRSYQMDESQTALSTIVVAGVTYEGAENGSYLNNGDVVVPRVGTYNVWFDKTTRKIGLEFLGASNLNAQNLMPHRLHGTEKIYMNCSNLTDWLGNSAKPYIYLFGGTGTERYLAMTRSGSTYYFYASIDTSLYTKCIFLRMNSSFNTTSGTGWPGDANVWNKTYDLDIPSDVRDGNTCYWINSWVTNTAYVNGDWGSDSSTARTYNYTIKVGTNAYTAMTWSASDNAYIYTISSCGNSTALAYQLNGETISVSKGSGDSGFNLNNTSSGLQVTRGGTNITVYLSTSHTVWISTVYEVKVGDNFYQASYVASGETDYNESYHQYKATVSGSAGDAVAVYVNGAVKTYTRDSDTYNNINSSKNLVKNASNNSVFLKFNKSGSNVIWSTCTVWADGNKTYELITNGNTFEMSYVNSGTYSGWYKAAGVSIASAGTATITLNGSTTTATEYNGGVYNSVISVSSNTISWPTTGITSTVDVYYDTSNHYVYATPVYTITIGSTTKQATYDSNDTVLRTTSTFNVTDGQAISAKVNDTSLTLSRKANNSSSDRNNISTTSLAVMYDATSVYGEISYSESSTSRTIWVSGYAPIYYYSTNSGSTWTQMTYNSATSTSQVTANIASGLAAGTPIRFRKSANNTSYNSSVSLDSGEFNNLTGSAGSLTTITTLTANTTLTLNFDTNVAYLGGRTLTYYWYNGDPGLAENQSYNAYLWQSDNLSNENAAYPGQTGIQTSMSFVEDNDDPRLWTLTFNADTGFNRVVFNFGTSTTTVAYQTFDIELTASNIGKYCRVSGANNGYAGYADSSDGNKLKWTTEWKNNLPAYGSDYTFYIADSNNSQFISRPYAYAWDNAGSYMEAGGAIFPGLPTTPVIVGNLYKFTCADEYDRIIFTNSSSSVQTADITDMSSHSGDVWIATGKSGSTVTGGWGSAKTHSVGSAKIYKSTNGSSWTEAATMYDGDLTTNDFMYELGVQAANGTYLKVETIINERTTTYSNSSNFIVDSYTRPYLTVNASSIVVKLSDDPSDTTTTARFNFYITTAGKLAIVMVPDLGNGIYIMPYTSSTEGFISATKMNTSSETSATYSGYYAASGDQIYIRSYLNAVDTLYTTINITGSGASYNPTTGVITFSAANYYDIEVAGGTVYISEYQPDDFFRLNALDVNNVANQNAIKGQKTTLVLEVAFTVTSNDFQMSTSIDIDNSLSNFTGISYYIPSDSDISTYSSSFTGRKLNDPYTYMRTNKYTLSTATTLTDANFLTAKNDDETIYYAYILIDYRYGSDFATLGVNQTGTMRFVLKTTQV